ncbi:Flagellar protein FliS [Symmachiella dynata]|uniref:Flagellar protein FliS n=1 Tax=Symmachiella dynata TaxID=2527995 RepID=A0A517ZJS2_9PLAN|nr:flagellar export chaperone FliS [Symmachiella dynata]QDU42728.1 Flagellar protein FliS [Symmachiella dynata]
MPAADQYLETQVLTAPPEQLHMLVVDGALRFARLGVQALGEANYELSHESFSRSREFVNELINGLKADGDEAMVVNLQAVFGFVYRALVDADGERDAQAATDAIKILEQHRQTWVELMEKISSERPATSTPTPHHALLDEQESPSRSWVS